MVESESARDRLDVVVVEGAEVELMYKSSMKVCRCVDVWKDIKHERGGEKFTFELERVAWYGMYPFSCAPHV